MEKKSVTLEQVLAARDRRAALQTELLGRERDAALVCLTLNIAGDIKRTYLTAMLFERGMAAFDALGLSVADSLVIDDVTGSEAFWLVRGDAETVKRQLEGIEDSFPAARLFDFDVLVSMQGMIPRKLSRQEARKCLICGRPAAECARSRAHGLDAIRDVTRELLRSSCAETLAGAACEALLEELYTTPKPGLVDMASNGAHTDMDIPLFEKSAESLRPYFHDAVLLGMDGCSMKELRQRGILAEKEMFEATGGVNTHKGLIYSMGLLLAGMGRAVSEADAGEMNTDALMTGEGEMNIAPSMTDAAVKYASELAGEDAEEKIAEALEKPVTNGAKVLRTYGARGAQGEAAAGFPDALCCEERLRYYIDAGLGQDRAGALAFCDSMARLEDTNLLHRGGPQGLDYARSQAEHISALCSFEERISELAELDGEMTKRGLSPGGSADMLALAFLLLKWRRLNERLAENDQMYLKTTALIEV